MACFYYLIKMYCYYINYRGVLLTHEEFEGRATSLGSFCSGCPDIDDNGHGSHVAGIVAGKTFGVAKKAKIVSVKALDSKGVGASADIINSLIFILIDAKKKKNNAIIKCVHFILI